MVLAGNFEQKLQAIISDAPYKYYGLSKIMACNFHLKLPASTIYLIIIGGGKPSEQAVPIN